MQSVCASERERERENALCTHARVYTRPASTVGGLPLLGGKWNYVAHLRGGARSCCVMRKVIENLFKGTNALGIITLLLHLDGKNPNSRKVEKIRAVKTSFPNQNIETFHAHRVGITKLDAREFALHVFFPYFFNQNRFEISSTRSDNSNNSFIIPSVRQTFVYDHLVQYMGAFNPNID